MTGPRPWWVEHPERLKVEESELESLGGRPPTLNEKLLADGNVRQYTFPYADGHGNTYDLTVTFPDLYPYFAPVVTSNHDFGAHREPGHGVLCLTRGGTAAWDVGDSAASLIREQMPKLLADRTDITTANSPAATDDEPVDGPPALPHVEAMVGYYEYQPSAGVRVDGAWSPLDGADSGTLVIGVDGYQPNGFRGTVLQVADGDGNVLAEADAEIVNANLYPAGMRLDGRWVRLAGPPPGPDAQSVLAAAVQADESLRRSRCTTIGRAEFDVVGIVFEDDLSADIATGTVTRGDAWIFVVRSSAKDTFSAPPKKRTKNKKGGGRYTPPARPQPPQLVRRMQSGKQDIFVRVPTLAPMQHNKIALFGTGGIGAPSAVEFAKAGLAVLHAVERDGLDPGNSVRWPFGYGMAGVHKLEALGMHLNQQWPYTGTNLDAANIGSARLDRDAGPQWEHFDGIVADCDLVYDATAEPGINYYLSGVAERHGVPYVVTAATEGGWGGYVGVFDPDSGGPCWTCLIHYFQDDRGRDEPKYLPPADPDPATRNAWPAGCNDPTFTGTGFDVGTIALAGVRLAAAVLCGATPGAHPAPDWNYARYSFRDGTRTLAGGAESSMLDPHPECRPCQRRHTN